MVYLKCCPRCRGDLFTERDYRDRYITCLQCGHILSTSEETVLQFRAGTWASLAPSQRQPLG
ncbi:MAG: hypothetical protein ACRDIY_18775 [Chloroflexota bacterium]